MERLTYDFAIGGNHCWQVKGADNLECRQVCEEQEENGCKGCPIVLAFDRLAAYENTGLTPEEVQQMRWIPVEERPPEEIGNYAYPPAHINREAWKPCEHCKPKCRICANCSILGKCGEPQVCVDCKDYSNFYSDYNYCDYCGRPLTEEAWKELEKRVRGENNGLSVKPYFSPKKKPKQH